MSRTRTAIPASTTRAGGRDLRGAQHRRWDRRVAGAASLILAVVAGAVAAMLGTHRQLGAPDDHAADDGSFRRRTGTR